VIDADGGDPAPMTSTAVTAPAVGGGSVPLLDRGKRPAVVVFAVVEVSAFGIYAWFGRRQWFFFDEWEFLAGRGLDPDSLLRPHVVHWTAVPVVIYRFLWSVFGLTTYRPYQWLAIAVHLLVAVLLRAVMRRAGVGPWIATIVATAFVLFGQGDNNVLWAFQIAFTLPIVFGLAHLLLADHDGGFDRRDWLGLLAGLAAIMSSGVGPPMVIAVGLAVLLRRGWAAALAHVVPLGAIYAAWWFAYGRDGPDALGHASAGETIRFTVSAYRAMFESLGWLAPIGWALAVALVAGLGLAWRHPGRAEVRAAASMPAGLLLASVAFLLVTGRGRGAGAVAAFEQSSRYLYVVAALVAPALAVAIAALYHRWPAVGWVVLALLVLAIPHGVAVISGYPTPANPDAPRSQAVDDIFLGRDLEPVVRTLPFVPEAEHAPRDLRPFPTFAPDVTLDWLDDAARDGKIAPLPSADQAALAQARFIVSIVQRDDDGPTATCTKVTAPTPRHLSTGDTMSIQGGALRVAPPPSAGFPASLTRWFDPSLGHVLSATANVDVTLVADNPRVPVTVCSGR
jgi:hypothetical protein